MNALLHAQTTWWSIYGLPCHADQPKCQQYQVHKTGQEKELLPAKEQINNSEIN